MKRLLVILPLMFRPVLASPACGVGVTPYEHELQGVQVGVMPYAQGGAGLQVALFATAHDGQIAQLAPITQGGAAQLGLWNLPPADEYNSCTGHTSTRPTHQVGVVNDAATARFQLGGCNSATRAHGVQVGCANSTEDLSGAQLGCLNDSQNGSGCLISVD